MTDFNVIVETTSRPTVALAEQVMDTLADYSAVVGSSPRGRADVILTVPATSLRQAVHTALAVVEPAISGHGRIVSVEAMTTREFDDRSDRIEPPPMPALVSVTEAADLLGVTRQAVLQRIETGSLPGIKIGTTWVLPKLSVASFESGKAKVLEELGPDATARDVLDRAARIERERKA